MPEYDAVLKEKIDNTAAEFSKTLESLAGLYENKFGLVVRKSVLDLFGRIIRGSPVDTGTYRASHMIANHEPSEDEGVIKIEKGAENPGEHGALGKVAAWTWKPGDGDIYIFNNVPYAEPLEQGHSSQAPEGVYIQAMTAANAVIKAQIVKLNVKDLFK